MKCTSTVPLLSGCITDTFEFYTVNEQGVKNNGSDGTGLLVAKKKNSEVTVNK